MSITHLFAGVAVADYDALLGWYECLFGRPPDTVPKVGEAVWHVTETAHVYVVADARRGGGGLLTLIVDDLHGLLADLAERGIVPAEVGPIAGVGRRATVVDPEGNTIQLAELGRER
jgi:predicted enzyme related to lactoylglutathione lyase